MKKDPLRGNFLLQIMFWVHEKEILHKKISGTLRELRDDGHE